jgi:hypothetical protein
MGPKGRKAKSAPAPKHSPKGGQNTSVSDSKVARKNRVLDWETALSGRVSGGILDTLNSVGDPRFKDLVHAVVQSDRSVVEDIYTVYAQALLGEYPGEYLNIPGQLPITAKTWAKDIRTVLNTVHASAESVSGVTILECFVPHTIPDFETFRIET